LVENAEIPSVTPKFIVFHYRKIRESDGIDAYS